MSEHRRFPWRTLTFISVALNLLVIGAIAGAIGAGVRVERQAPAAIVDRLPGPRAFIAALPPETQQKMRRELVESWRESRELRRAAIQARRDAFAAAATEPYDAARVRAAFAQLRAADQAAIGIYHDNIADAIGRLSPEERRAALEALRRAAPAARQSVTEPNEDAGAAQPTLQERRERRRERLREWREQRRDDTP